MSENPFTDGQQFSAARLNSMYSAHQNEGVLNGLDVTTSVNNFDVDVASGNVFLNGSNVAVSSTTVSHSTSDPEDRVDLLSVDDTGSINITQGNPASTSGQPIAPDIPTSEILICLIYVRGNSTEILTGDIFADYRVTLATDVPAFSSPQGDFQDATVANAPTNATDVVRQTELVSGNPHADSASFSDLPYMQEYSQSTSFTGTSPTTYASFSFSQTAYLHSYRLVSNSSASASTLLISRISTNNFSDAVSDVGSGSNNKVGVGGFNRTTQIDLIADGDDQNSGDTPGGTVSAKLTVLIFP